MRFSLNLLCFFLSLFPPHIFWVISAVLSVVSFDILRVRRSVILKNLQIAFPQWSAAQKRSVGRKSVFHFCLTMFEFMISARYFKKTKVTIYHGDYLNNALALKKGAYVQCIHIGNWELLCYQGSQNFAPVHSFVKDVGKKEMATWVNSKRAENLMQVIERKSPLQTQKRIVKVLRDNHILGFIVDQRRNTGPLIPFYGKPSHTNTSLIQLALRRPAPIVPAVLVRRGIWKHDMIFFPELKFDREASLGDEALQFNGSVEMNRMIEKMIEVAPEQYFWMHDRFKIVHKAE